MIKLGKFPIRNCTAEVEGVVVFDAGRSLRTGDTFCSVRQRLPVLEIKKAGEGVEITCQEDCREREK